MTLNYEQTAEDVIDFNYYYHWFDPSKKRKAYLTALFPLCIFLVLIALAKGSNFKKYGPGEALLLSGGVLFVVLQGDWVYSNCKRFVRNVISNGKTVDLLGSRTIVLEEDQLVETTSNTCSQLRWSAFEKVGETKTHFFLFFGGNQGIIVPKHVFNEASEESAFRSFVTTKINSL